MTSMKASRSSRRTARASRSGTPAARSAGARMRSGSRRRAAGTARTSPQRSIATSIAPSGCRTASRSLPPRMKERRRAITSSRSTAGRGWVVFQPNYRGSDNAGNAFTRAILDDSGAGPGRDVMAGVGELKKRGFIDDSRIAVGGWSYGGYMTSWMIGHYPIFKAAVSGAAVNNLLDEYVLSDSSLSRRLTWGSPFVGDNMKKYVEQSPITYASRIKTPTLIMSDTGDVRVPITQSYQMYYALKDNGVPVKFVAFPVSGYSPEDPIHATEIEKQYVNWFAQYLK